MASGNGAQVIEIAQSAHRCGTLCSRQTHQARPARAAITRGSMVHKPGPYGVPEHTDFTSTVNAAEQISSTENVIQTAAHYADSVAGPVLSQIAQAQSNLAIAAALREINQTLRETNKLQF